ncbi:hypothetical protein D9M71_698860 [compost metagenome]
MSLLLWSLLRLSELRPRRWVVVYAILLSVLAFGGHLSDLVVQVDLVVGWVIWTLTLGVDHGLSSSISPSLGDISAWIPLKRSGY